MAVTNPPPLRVPKTSDPQLNAFLEQLARFSYLLWDQVGGRGTVPVSAGGTGGDTPEDARAALGLSIGTNVQAFDAGLTSIAGLTTGANKMVYTTALDAYAVADLTAFARTLLDDADAATARTTLGLGSGSSPSFTSLSTGALTATGAITFSSVPANASDTGTAGMMAVDANYLYRCTATDTWKRTALATW